MAVPVSFWQGRVNGNRRLSPLSICSTSFPLSFPLLLPPYLASSQHQGHGRPGRYQADQEAAAQDHPAQHPQGNQGERNRRERLKKWFFFVLHALFGEKHPVQANTRCCYRARSLSLRRGTGHAFCCEREEEEERKRNNRGIFVLLSRSLSSFAAATSPSSSLSLFFFFLFSPLFLSHPSRFSSSKKKKKKRRNMYRSRPTSEKGTSTSSKQGRPF